MASSCSVGAGAGGSGLKHVKRSPCWKYFDKSSIENNDDNPKSIVRCKLCNDELTFYHCND